MSIISQFTAGPNRVEMLIDFLKTNKSKYTKKDLENIFSPQSGSVFKEVFKVVEMLNLLTIKEDLVLHNIENKKQNTLKIIKDAIFNIDYIKDDNFNLSLAWLLVQHPQEMISFQDNVGNRLVKDLSEQVSELELTNTANFQHFIYWCEYLGFVNKISISGETFISPDPTIAIKEELNINFKKNTTFTVKDFFIMLSKNLPILEYGYVREKITPMLRDGLFIPIDTLSYSTSLAILRLEQQHIVSLESKADADIIILQDGTNNQRISHIKYLGQ
ncbi:MAG: hypothetical protein DRG78_07975 [Epsilonproteobacteria bacterium]|nr:MAG: hypothetical protein DRG78_07975 [Campylobacterota bacterium]